MKTISKFYNLLIKDSLYRNAIYLMLSIGVMAVLGFFFWIINARLYSAEQVGIGTTLISIMTLISSFSILGLGNGLIRYLPTSERKNKKINTSFTIVALMSILISVIYLIFLKTFSPKLLFHLSFGSSNDTAFGSNISGLNSPPNHSIIFSYSSCEGSLIISIKL